MLTGLTCFLKQGAKRMRKTVFLTAVMLIAFSRASAQQQPRQSIHYQPGDWITYTSFRNVTSVAEGNQYIYFGTTGGITRFHIYQRTWDEPLTRSDGLPSGRITAVAFDKSTGLLWCSDGRYLCYFLTAAREWRIIDLEIYGVSRASRLGVGDTGMWAVSDRGILSIDSFGGYLELSSSEKAAGDNVHWFSVQGSRQRDEWPQYFMEDGFRFLPGGIIQDRYFQEFPIVTWAADQFGSMWFGTRGLGAGRIDTRSDNISLLPFGPYTLSVSAMAWDPDGMWIGGLENSPQRSGITFWNMAENTWQYFQPRVIRGLESTRIHSICVSGWHVWFATDQGLVGFDRKNDSWRTYHVQDNLWSDSINYLVPDGSTVWVATDAGLNRIDTETLNIERVQDEVLRHRYVFCVEGTPEAVYAGTDRGIMRMERKTGKWMYVPGSPSMPVLDVYAISVWNEEVWFGTDSGAAVFNEKTGEWKTFLPQHHPVGTGVNTILADSMNVWFGTDSGVLKYIKNEDRWFSYTKEDGLAGSRVLWILLDGDYIWFGTDRGLTKFFWNAPYRID